MKIHALPDLRVRRGSTVSACEDGDRAAVAEMGGANGGVEGRRRPHRSLRSGARQVEGAPDHDNEWGWGQVAGVAVDHADRIIVVTRGDWPADG